MVLLGIVEIAVYIVSGYNLARGFYDFYTDANKIKKTYKEHQRISKQYTVLTTKPNLTESTYSRFEGEFLII